MAICRKTNFEVISALLALTLVLTSAFLTWLGVSRYYWDLEDDKNNNRQHFILAGNVLSVFALGATLYVLFDSGDQGLFGFGAMLTMLFNMVVVLYLTNYDPTDKNSNVITLVFAALDVYLKATAILVGYGTCNTGDLVNGLSGLTRTLVGGRRR